MNILFAGALAPQTNGAAQSSSEVLSLLADAGHHVVAFAQTTPDFPEMADVDAKMHAGIDVTRLDAPYFEEMIKPPPPDYLRAFRHQVASAVGQALAAQRFDVILVGKESWTPGMPALAHRARLPCVVVARGALLSVLDNKAHDLARDVLHEMRQADLVITCAIHLESSLRAHGLTRIETIANAIDAARFRPGRKPTVLLHELAIPSDACVVAHASHLAPVKRPVDIVESAAPALQQDARLVYLIVGGSTHYSQADAMRSACARLRIEDRFRFVDWQPYEQMPRYLQLADVVVYPSASEGLCRGYLEAMACGRTLIASDIPAAREVVDHNVNGLLFPVGDVEALARETLLAASDPALRRRLGQQARKTVVEGHTPGHLVSAYEAAFDSAIGSDARQRGTDPL